jgi:hypothetical protein
LAKKFNFILKDNYRLIGAWCPLNECYLMHVVKYSIKNVAFIHSHCCETEDDVLDFKQAIIVGIEIGKDDATKNLPQKF